ncbi:ABC transporter permease [Streptomyces sp. NPDC001351]|uniref:ABC transporter permease n=1 Tax=Streptomyces sp. NPDC001351 TaxID=3364564 RepID=UPI0036A27DC6
MALTRFIAVSMALHMKNMCRSPVFVVILFLAPILRATLAVYLFRSGTHQHALVQATVGAGLMGAWSSVLFGSGGAIQQQRWQGTLELLVMSPRSLVLVMAPIALATAAMGGLTVAATLVWGRLIFGVPLKMAHPIEFVPALLAYLFGLGLFGILLASTFVRLPNANAVANTLEYPIWMLSGILVELSDLPSWTGPLSAILPSTWGASAIRHTVSGGHVWHPLWICLALGLVALALGTAAMRAMERKARVEGTLALS